MCRKIWCDEESFFLQNLWKVNKTLFPRKVKTGTMTSIITSSANARVIHALLLELEWMTMRTTVDRVRQIWGHICEDGRRRAYQRDKQRPHKDVLIEKPVYHGWRDREVPVSQDHKFVAHEDEYICLGRRLARRRRTKRLSYLEPPWHISRELQPLHLLCTV